MSHYDEASVPMALDDVRLADSGQSAALTPMELATLDGAADAASPEPLDLISSIEQPAATPVDAEGAGGVRVFADDDAAAPALAHGIPPGAAAAEAELSTPMDLDRLLEIEQR